MALHIDFETRSAADLKAVGTYLYAAHGTTDVLCAAFRLDDGPVWLWKPGDPTPKTIIAAVKRRTPILAWNAQFERLIWRHVLTPRYGWPAPRIEQFHCVAARARAMGFPSSLERAALFAGLPPEACKDMTGHRIMLKLSRPRGIAHDGSPVWWDSPQELELLYRYCQQDVVTESTLCALLRPLPPEEQRLYTLTEALNDRGVHVDRRLIEAALRAREHGAGTVRARLIKLTKGRVTSINQVSRLIDWIKGRGVQADDLRADTVSGLLESDDLPPDVREVLELRQEYGRASTSKFAALRDRCGEDGVLRGAFVYHGAATGRFSSAGVQVHNLLRDSASPEEVERFLDGTGTDTPLPRLVRPAFVPARGKWFLIADYTAIEAVVLPWLAHGCGVGSAGPYLERWRKQEPIYKQQASALLGIPVEAVTDEQRQIGKIATLALGYGGGEEAFRTMARGYGLTISPEQAQEWKAAWRQANAWAPRFWRLLDSSIMQAMTAPGEIVDLGALAYVFVDPHLWCRLPSGRVLCYPFARLNDMGTVDYRRGNRKPAKGEKEWPRTELYGGLAAENVTQAVARDVLCCAIAAIEETPSLTLRLHVHDELVAEAASTARVPPAFERAALAALRAPWAKGLPLFIKARVAARYGKG